MKESWPLPDHLLQTFTSWNWVCIAYLSGIGSAFLTFSSSSAIRSNFHWRRLDRIQTLNFRAMFNSVQGRQFLPVLPDPQTKS